MIRIAVCDDESRVLNRTKEMLLEYQKEELQIELFLSGEELLASKEHYDIILLDIDMGGMNGIETARQIRNRDKTVTLIYVTNYVDYTIFAFAVHAFAYLLKPLQKEALFAQLEEALSYRNIEPEEELEFMTREGIIRLAPKNILYFEYQDRRVLLFAEEKVWHLKDRITDIAGKMEPYGFVMPHKSFVLNLYSVQSIKGYDILLTNGKMVPLSQKKSVEFRKSLNAYLAKERGYRV